MPSRQKKEKSTIIKSQITPNQRIDLVKPTAAGYIITRRSASCDLKRQRNRTMAVSAQKPRPANVPEENVYEKTHWLLIVTYLVAALSVYLLISKAG